MTAPAVIVTDADTLRQIVREELAAALATQQHPAPVPATDEPAFYTADEAAAHLKVGLTEIYRAVREGEIQKTPIGSGRNYRISREALRQYAQRQQERAA